VLLSPVAVTTDEIPRLIDKYYNDLVTVISASCRKAIPCKKSKGCAADYTVLGWSDFVCDRHDDARSAFLDWVKGKVKVFPYSLLSVGPGADPGVQAVSPQVT